MAIISEISYLRDALVNAIRFYYHFLVSMYMDESMIDEPPENGWETIPNGWINFEKTDEVIDLLRRLPYLSYEFGVIYWYKCLDEVRFMDDQAEGDGYGWADDGRIPEDQAEWKYESGVWPIKVFFEILKRNFEQLNFAPIGSRIVKAMWGSGSNQTREILFAVQKIYRDHAWPDRARYSKEDCLEDIKIMLKAQFPDETLGAAVSQATTFESQFFESQTEEEGAAEGSQAGTAATTEASVDTEPDNGDNFDGINWDRLLEQGSNSLRQTLETGVAVSQEAANAMGNFNIQQFREVAVFCLLDNNLPMELLARPSFREMISLANPEAEAALWVSPRSVATYAMRLFQYMQPQIVCALSEAASKIHISFDGWTTKGGKRGFFGVVAHFANASGVIQDLPIALPHLAGSHTGDAIADTIKKTPQEYSIGSDKLGYFVLDNAANNDTAVSSLAHAYDFNAAHRRLRCGPHTLNLIGQAIIFGSNQEAYNNNNDEQLQTEEVYMQEWRQEGPLGVLIDVINHIKTPQQHEIFRSFQTAANAELPARERLHVLEPVKPVVTRWNSYYAAFKRATQLQAAYNSYAEHYINALP
ncbi:hypothetical protein A1F94_009251 [Pyrenophora tritici-repentis]|nr:hypothetical protein A1F94_009251 [Pyrenophora tritici-repentis]